MKKSDVNEGADIVDNKNDTHVELFVYANRDLSGG